MSGWDVSSTPTWGSQDGPDETQAFKASGGGGRGHGQEFGAPEFGGGYPGESAAGGPPPEYFGQDYGQDHDLAGGYPQRTPGQSFQDLPRREAPRGRHSGMQAGGDYGQDNGYGQEASYGQDWGGNGADQADNWGAGGQDNGGWGRTEGRSVAPWDERSHGDAGYGDAGYGDAGYGGAGYGDADGGGFGQQDFGRDSGHQFEDHGFSAQDYPGADFPGPQGHGEQAPMDFDYQGRDVAARNDPALQDFFAPAGGGPGFSDEGRDWPGGDTPRDRFRQADEDADWPGRTRTRPPADADVDWTGRPRGQRPAPHRDDDDDSGGIGTKGLVAIGAVVFVVIAVAAYMFLHKSGGSTPTASSSPTTVASTPAAKPTASKGTGTGAGTGGTTTPAYTLVNPPPSKASVYPIGQDPNDLANATATAKQIVSGMTSAGDKVTGNPESAAYTVPASQVITFVGYQGTFTPANVKSVLTSLGTDVNSYPAGPDGGVLYCANTKTAPSGAVCVWATSSTLGITEFYGATAPEPLTSAQSKGASDTVNVRADLEKKS